MHRCKLSADRLATDGLHPSFESLANSIITEVYAGPIFRPLPGFGTIFSLISRLRERLAKSTITDLGLSNDSGALGIREIPTLRNLAIRSRSAKSQASISLTATRKHIKGAGFGKCEFLKGGAQSESWSRSIRITQGLYEAARLYAFTFFKRALFPCFPYTVPILAPNSTIKRRSTASSKIPSTAAVICIGFELRLLAAKQYQLICILRTSFGNHCISKTHSPFLKKGPDLSKTTGRTHSASFRSRI